MRSPVLLPWQEALIDALTRYTNAARFHDAFRGISLEREAELNLMLGLAEMRRDDVGDALLVTLGDPPRGAAMRTPPSGLVFAELAEGAADELATELAREDSARDAGSVVGATRAVERFARCFGARVGREPRLSMAQKIYWLTKVSPPARAASGRLRLAVAEDLSVVESFVEAFRAQTEGSRVSAGSGRAIAESRIAASCLHVWEDAGVVVSMAALARPTARGVAVNLVYTPPSLRGRGYASASVAALSQVALDSGRAFTCLFTDAANPTSNAIYQRIGYRFVADCELWRFGATT